MINATRNPAAREPDEDRASGGNRWRGAFVRRNVALIAFMTIPGLVIALVAFAVLDRAGLWAHRRFRLPWKRDEVGRPVSAIAVGELDAFFHGTHRHQQEQRRSSLILRDDLNDGAPPRSRVDLDAGTAIVRRPPDSAGT